MFTIAIYIKTLKQYAKDKSISTENFAREVFDILISNYDIKNQRGKTLDLDKAYISKIMSGKVDVPKAIRAVLAYADIDSVVLECFEVFSQDYLDIMSLSNVIEKIDTLIENDSRISSQEKNNLREQQNDQISYLASTFLLAIKVDNRLAINHTILFKRGNSSVQLISGDLFKYGFDNRLKEKNIVVIPVNTAFDTHISYNAEKDLYPVISDKTIHGQWVKKILKSGLNIDLLNQRISENLKLQNISAIDHKKAVSGKTINYPIGSIAVIETSRAIFYLLAISEFDDKNMSKSTENDIKKAIQQLLIYYNQNGQGLNLYMPLIGTGRSRTGMDYQDSLNEIKKVLDENSIMIQGNIYIVVQPQVLEEINIREQI